MEMGAALVGVEIDPDAVLVPKLFLHPRPDPFACEIDLIGNVDGLPLGEIRFRFTSPVGLVAELDHELDGLHRILAFGQPLGFGQPFRSPWFDLVAAFGVGGAVSAGAALMNRWTCRRNVS